jgi:2-oxoglutarate ferredoxin oxidoreductase subunit alpha
VDGDGIPWRTLPGTHPSKGSFFTRGTTRDAYARYSEKGVDYIYNMERLDKKFKTAANIVPAPIVTKAAKPSEFGVIYFGSTSPAMTEAFEMFEAEGVHMDGMRLRAYPFPDSVNDFINEHKLVFVVEQNRDAQMRTLIINEFDTDPAQLVKVLHYDGTPITARFIHKAITDRLAQAKASKSTKTAKEHA